MPMVVAELCDSISRHTGMPIGRVRMVARRLAEAGILMTGSGKTRPVVNLDHAVMLLIGLLTDRPLHSVAPGAVEYGALLNAESDTSLRQVLRNMLAALCDAAWTLNGSRGIGEAPSVLAGGAYHSLVEVCSSRPEARISFATTDGDPVEMAFTVDGGKFEPHLDGRLRACLSISGSVLSHIAYDIAGKMTAAERDAAGSRNV